MHKIFLALLLASMVSTPILAQAQAQQARPQLTEEQRRQRQAQARARQQAQQQQAQQPQARPQLTEEQRRQRQAQARARQQAQQQQVQQPQARQEVQQIQIEPPQQEQVLVREQQSQKPSQVKKTKTKTKTKTQAKKPQTQTRKRSGGANHRWSISVAFLEQNGPFREFAFLSNNLWYAVQFPVWGLSNAAFGFSIGGAYDYTFNNKLMIRFQYGLETAGWITGFFDLGIGLRVPLNAKVNLTMEGYFSIVQTGATLGLVSLPVPSFPEQFKTYLGIFGFKGRLSLEIALKKNYFIAPYVSYAVYPWVVSSLKNMSINGFSQGYLIDSLNIGIEFGQKF